MDDRLEMVETEDTSEDCTDYNVTDPSFTEAAIAGSGLVGREVQLRQLFDAYSRISRQYVQSELVLISGPCGAGKTSLALAVEPLISRKKGYFITGKCTHVLSASQPFAPFHEAVSDLVDKALERGIEQLQRLKESITEATAGDTQILTDMIPALRWLFPTQQNLSDRSLSSPVSENKCFMAFGEVISKMATKEHPICLMIDDIQWIDPDSIKLLQELMEKRRIPNVLVIACLTEGEIEKNAPLIKMLEELESKRVYLSEIKVTNLSQPSMDALVAAKLGQSLQRCRDLSQLIQGYSQGHALDAVQLIETLKEEGLIACDREENFTWDVDSIQERLNSTTVDQILVASLANMEGNCIKEVLKVASCLGFNFDIATIGVTTSHSFGEVKNALGILTEKRLIVKESSNAYCWSHARLQEAAYSLIPDENKICYHVDIAKRLLARLPQPLLEDKVFIVLRHCSFSMDSFRNDKERYKVAGLCLSAGVRAARSSAFEVALAHFLDGIDLLGPDHWKEAYDLSLALFNAAAEMKFSTGKLDGTDQHIESVLSNARNLEDKLRAYETRIYVLGSQQRFKESQELGTTVLKELGEPVNPDPSMLSLIAEVLWTKRILRKKNIVDILMLPKMRSKSKLAAMRIMHMMYAGASRSQPKLATLLVVKGIRMTLNHGLCPPSAMCFAAFGVVLCHPLGYYSEGVKLAETGLSVTEEFRAEELKCRTFIGLYGFAQPWKSALSQCLSPLTEATRLGRISGDIEMVALTLFLRSCFEVFSGFALGEITENMKMTQRLLQEEQQDTLLAYYSALHQMVLNLTTHSERPLELTGVAMNEKEALASHEMSGHAVGIAVILLCKVYLAVYLDQYEDAYKISLKLRKFNIDAFNPALVYQVHFLDALSEIVSAQRGFCKTRKGASGKRGLSKLELYEKHCPDNVRGKILLLRAERDVLKGDHEKAKAKFDASIEFAAQQGNIPEHALAWERAAGYLIKSGNELEGRQSYKKAQCLYREWGSSIKGEQLAYLCIDSKLRPQVMEQRNQERFASIAQSCVK